MTELTQENMTVSIVLPYPVSVNAMYRNVRGKGRVKTKKYIDWVKDAEMRLWGIHWKQRIHIYGKVQIHIKVKRPDKRKRDIDNVAKGILDFLVNFPLIDDDCNVEKLIIEWVYDGPEGATVQIDNYPA